MNERYMGELSRLLNAQLITLELKRLLAAQVCGRGRQRLLVVHVAQVLGQLTCQM